MDKIVQSKELINKYIYNYKNIMISISGGSDSDLLVDLLSDINVNKYWVYVDTGIEYNATKLHLDYIEKKYKIKIERLNPNCNVPSSCNLYGEPFISKHVSEMISRLQKYNFKWENENYDILSKRYPNCISAVKWWCNYYNENSKFNISRNKKLKEYMIDNPPNFKIGNFCCKNSKIKTLSEFKKKNNIDLSIIGVRSAEGGVRSTAYDSVMTINVDKPSEFRPILWFSDDDKIRYNSINNIENSDCYKIYKLKRTGCAGCPINRNYKNELNIIKEYEPFLYNNVLKCFKESYDYTDKYIEYREGN